MLTLNGVGSLTAKLVKEQLLGVLFEIRVLKHVYDRCWLHPEVRAVSMEVRFQAASGHFAASCLLCPA